MYKTLAVLIVVVGLLMWGFSQNPLPIHFGDKTNACTAEALLCPDGSSVGRSGPQCTFSACPSEGTLTGELERSNGEFHLITKAPEGGAGATFVVPLVVDNFEEADSLVGSRVVVSGTFTEGTILHVAAIAAAYEPNARKVSLHVGEEGMASGVRIALNSVSDSRCPSNVQCVHAGWVDVDVELLTDTDRATTTLRLGGDAYAVDSFKVSVVGVSPEATSGSEIAQGDYRITFKVDPLAE